MGNVRRGEPSDYLRIRTRRVVALDEMAMDGPRDDVRSRPIQRRRGNFSQLVRSLARRSELELFFRPSPGRTADPGTGRIEDVVGIPIDAVHVHPRLLYESGVLLLEIRLLYDEGHPGSHQRHLFDHNNKRGTKSGQSGGRRRRDDVRLQRSRRRIGRYLYKTHTSQPYLVSIECVDFFRE